MLSRVKTRQQILEDNKWEGLYVPYSHGRVGRLSYDFAWMKCPGIKLQCFGRPEFKGISWRIWGYKLTIGIVAAK